MTKKFSCRAAWVMGLLPTVLVASISSAGLSRSLPKSYYNFDESSTGTTAAFDRFGRTPGTFEGAATRVPGIIGAGAAGFSGNRLEGVNIGSSFAASKGITIEAMIASKFRAGESDEDHIFRKEDSDYRILLSFDVGTDFPEVPVPFGPVLSFGLHVGGWYGELDMPLDGRGGRPSLAEMRSGSHYVVATYDSNSGRKVIYIDGTERFGTTLSGDIFSGGDAAAYIGNDGGGNGNDSYEGTIDEFALYDRAISAEEVAAHYQNAHAGVGYFAGGSTAVPLPPAAWTGGVALIAALVYQWLRVKLQWKQV